MKKLLLLTVLILNFGCESTEISTEKALVGEFKSNAFLDPACLLLPEAFMPRMTIKNSLLNDLSIEFTKPLYNQKSQTYDMISEDFKGITTSEDIRGTVLTYRGIEFGYFGIPATYSGSDRTKRLWIRYEDKVNNKYVFFVGEKK